MGGYGSGPSGGRPTVETSLRIDLPQLRRAGFLKPGCRVAGIWQWTRHGEPAGSVDIAVTLEPEGRSDIIISFRHDDEPISQEVRLVGVPMPFGGWRWFALCPVTGRRCTTLVLPIGGRRFASILAWRLPYASQREDIFGRAHRRIAKATARLDRMSKYARRPTRQRQWDRIVEAEAVLDQGLELALRRLAGV
jgi:hypothetical protein